MKKIYYLFAFIIAAGAFTACKPLSKTYDQLGDIPKPQAPAVTPATTASITLAAADYAGLPASNDASSQGFFHSTSDAFASIPSILAKKYPLVGDKSTITVTYATSPVVPVFKLADSLNANTAITLQTTPTDDYKFPAFTYQGANIAANNFDDLSATVVISWLKYKNQTPPPDNTLRVLTYLYFESGATASTGNLQTDAFLFTAATGWQKIYRISNAQYASVNRGTNNWFLASDVASNATLPAYFNAFLKADAAVMATAKVGTVINVNYRYLTTYQRVMPMVYDGINWVASNTTATTAFVYSLSNNTWAGQLDNTVNYTLATADYAAIGAVAANAPISAGATAISNMVTNTDFTLNSSTATSRWTDAQIANGIILGVLKTKYPSPAVNQKYQVTFKTYSQYPTETDVFIYDGTNFVYQPTPDNSKYMITGDDYVAIAADATTGASAAAQTNLNSFGDFTISAAYWTQAQINIGLANVLKTRYPKATSGQAIVVSYAIYSGGAQTVTAAFKYNGTAWTL